MDTRPFLLLGASQLAAVAHKARAALVQWCAQWGVSPDGAEVDATPAWESALPERPVERVIAGAEGRSLSCFWSGGRGPLSQRALFSLPRQTGQLVGEVAERADQALLAALAAGLGLDTSLRQVADDDMALRTLLTRARQPGSGAALLRVHLAELDLWCVLEAGAVPVLDSPPRPRPSALAPCRVGSVCAGLPVRLPVQVGSAEVDLGSVAALGVGDVIRLDTPLDAPIQVKTAEGRSMFMAYPGRSGDGLVIEVAAGAVADPSSKKGIST